MVRPIVTSIPHSLGKDEARRRIQAGFEHVEQQLGTGLLGLLTFRNRWDADRLNFEGTGMGQTVSGRLDVLDDAVRLEIDLPELLAALADRVLKTVKTQTQLLLERK